MFTALLLLVAVIDCISPNLQCILIDHDLVKHLTFPLCYYFPPQHVQIQYCTKKYLTILYEQCSQTSTLLEHTLLDMGA